MNFNNKDVKEEVGGGKYIYPGIYDEVIIQSVEEFTNTNNKQAVRVNMYTKAGGAENAKSFDFWMTTDKAQAISQSKLKHIATKVTAEANFSNIVADSLGSYCSQLNNILAGRELRMQFNGEEYEYDGKVREAAIIGLPPFAEATQQGAAYPAVSKTDSKLVYNKEDARQFKKMDVSPTSENTVTASPNSVAANEELFD